MLKFFSRLIIILVLALAVVAGAGFAAYHFLPTAPTSSDSTVDEDVLKDDTYNILLCGVDGKHENADTIVLASFNTERKPSSSEHPTRYHEQRRQPRHRKD